MAYTRKKRADGGEDFYNGNKKITVDEFVKATGANKQALVQELADRGDKYSQQYLKKNSGNQIGKNLLDFTKTIGSGIQQGLGAAGDVALQGGAILGEIGNYTNPFINETQRKAKEGSQLKNTENIRKLLQSNKDLEGKAIVGTSDVDESANKIATGQGTIQDAANVLGKGFEVANTTTMFANPLSLAKGATAKQVVSRAAQDAALFGTTGGTQAGLQTYGQTGDLGAAAKAAGTGALIGGATAGALDIAAPLAGAVARSASKAPKAVVSTVNEARPSVIASKDPRVVGYDDQYATLAQQFDNTPDPIARREVSKAMAQNRVERLNARKSIEREVGQGGYIRLPGDEPSATPNVDRSQEIPQQILPEQNRISAQEPVPSQISNQVDSLGNGNIEPSISQALPDNNPRSRFAAQTAPNSGNLSPELAQQVRDNASSYSKVTNKDSVDESINFLSSRTEDEAIDDVLTRLSQKNIDRQSVTDAIATASSLDSRGGARNLELAQNIYDRLSEQLTKAGQTVQAASIISRRTPEGMAYNALRELQKAEVPVTPDIRQAIVTKTQEIGQLKLGSEARERATAELQKQVNSLIPTELVDKIVGTWKAGLLTGIRTTTGGALSNALFRGLREVSRPGAVATDMIASIFTGKRSTALTARGALSGTTEGASKAGKYLKSGVDERSFSADGKYIDREINFKNPVLKTYVNGVFRVMGAADRPFYYSQFRNSLAEAAEVAWKNRNASKPMSKSGVKSGWEGMNQSSTAKALGYDKNAKARSSVSKQNFIEDYIKNPPDDGLQFATDIAEQAVLANDTLLSNIANKLREAVSKQENAAVRGTGKLALGVLAPFTKVPSAFLTRVIDFTPIGAVKEAVVQMANKKLNQQKLVQAISEAGTGTGLIYLGAELANNDLLTGNYPNDPKEAARWKTEGIIPNAIKLGDTYYSLNYAGPVGALFGIGKSIADSAKEGGDVTSALTAGVTQLASGTLEQSFLSGISGALDAVQDPGRYAENFVRSQAGSVIPTLLNDIGNATDETQRQTNTPLEAIQGRLPGARTALNPKIDSFGNDIEQANPNQLGRLVDPFRPSKERTTPVTDELDRLADAGQSIFPSNDKTIKVANETIKLDGDQQYEYNTGVGNETQLIWNGIINSPDYQTLSDEQKKDMLSNATTDINAVAKKQYLEKIGRTDLADKVDYTKRQEEYALGTIDPTLWLPKDSEVATARTAKAKEEKATAKKASTKKTASKKSSGSRRIGFKAPNSGGFKRTASTSAIRKLLSSAGASIKAQKIT